MIFDFNEVNMKRYAMDFGYCPKIVLDLSSAKSDAQAFETSKSFAQGLSTNIVAQYIFYDKKMRSASGAALERYFRKDWRVAVFCSGAQPVDSAAVN